MRSPQLTADSGAAHVKEGGSGKGFDLFIDGVQVDLAYPSNLLSMYWDAFGDKIETRQGSFTKTITLDPLSHTFIEDYYTYTKKK